MASFTSFLPAERTSQLPHTNCLARRRRACTVRVGAAVARTPHRAQQYEELLELLLQRSAPPVRFVILPEVVRLVDQSRHRSAPGEAEAEHSIQWHQSH